MKQPILFMLIFSILLTACSSAPTQITEPMADSTSIPIPTITSTPALTPVPVGTVTPMLVPSPMPVLAVTISVENAGELVALNTLDGQEGSKRDASNHAIFSTDGNFMIRMEGYAKDKHPTLTYWDIKNASSLQPVEVDTIWLQSSITFDPTGTLFASATDHTKESGRMVKIFQSKDGTEIARIQEMPWGVADLEWSADGKLFAIGSLDGHVSAYQTSDYSLVFEIKIQGNRTNAVAFSPDNSLLAAAGHDEIVRIWNTSDWSKKIVFERSDAPIYDIVFSPDGKFLAAAESGGATSSDPGQLSVWDVVTGKKLLDFNPQYKVFSVEYSPDGSLLVAGGQDGHVRIWRTDTYEMVADLTGHKTRVVSLDFSPDGTLLASGSISTFNIYESDPDKQGFREQVILWGLP